MKCSSATHAGPTRLPPPGVRIPVDLILVHDHSGSIWLDAHAWSTQRCSAATALRLLGADVRGVPDRVGFVGFGTADDSEVIHLQPLSNEADRVRLVDQVGVATFCKGWTDYDAALGAVIEALQDGDRRYASPPFRVAGRATGVLFLSDGLPQLDTERDLDPLAVTPAGLGTDLFRERGWPMFTVALGSPPPGRAAVRLLRDMAEATSGRSFTAAAARDMNDICAEVIRRIEWTAMKAWCPG